MDNEQANSPLGLMSRQLAFAFLSGMDKDWQTGKVDRLQVALFDYGDALAKRIAEAAIAETFDG